jgi:hypothetical protein
LPITEKKKKTSREGMRNESCIYLAWQELPQLRRIKSNNSLPDYLFFLSSNDIIVIVLAKYITNISLAINIMSAIYKVNSNMWDGDTKGQNLKQIYFRY